MSDEEKKFYNIDDWFLHLRNQPNERASNSFLGNEITFCIFTAAEKVNVSKKIKLKIIFDLSNFLGKNETGRYARQLKRIFESLHKIFEAVGFF